MEELTRNDFIEANNEGKPDMFEEAFDNMVEFATSATEKRARIAELNNKLEKVSHGAVALAAEVARLTAGSEAMQEDARNNTATINTLMAQLAELKACKHMHVKIHSRLWRASTREEPAEFEYKAECKDCGELFSADDVDEWAEVEE